MQYDIFNYPHHGILQISRTQSFCITKILYPLTDNFSFPPTPTISGNYHYMLCFYEWLFQIPHVSEIMQYLSVHRLFHFAQCPSVSSMLLQMANISSFSWINNIPLYIHCIYSTIDGNLGCFHILAGNCFLLIGPNKHSVKSLNKCVLLVHFLYMGQNERR